VVGASTIAHDITARKEAEEALRRSRDEERRLRAELEELGRASAAVTESVADLPPTDHLPVDLSTVLSMIALQAQSLTRADYVALGIGNDPKRSFHPWVFLGMSQEDARAIGRFPRPVATLGRVAREGEVLRAADLRHHVHFRGLPPHHPEMASFLGVPIRHRGRPVGNLYLANRPGGAEFSEQDERLVCMLAARVAAVIETASLYVSSNLQRVWLQNVIDQMPDCVLLYDEHGVIKATNQGATGLSCAESDRTDPFGNPIAVELRGIDGSVLSPDRLPLFRVLKNHEVIVREEMLVQHNNGELIPVVVNAGPVRDATGDISGAMVIIQNISDRKALERLREEWSAVVAHDLRQPVNTIGLAAEILLRRPAHELTERDRRSLERIGTASKRLNRMINDLLDVSRIESQRMVIECQPVDLGTFIDAVVNELEAILPGHEVRVVVRAEEVVWIDPDRVHQVIANLISNAVKYGSPDTEIRIEAIRRGDLVEVVVTNHGPGIPPDQLPLLFSRFVRAGGPRGAPGLGLGLYIARGLIEAHGGWLWAESIPGETTSFHFTLPRIPRARR
jgi:signal transduction histidine kinase